jgi:hypothetical protein
MRDGAQEAQVTRSERLGPGGLEQYHPDPRPGGHKRHGRHRLDAQPTREARPHARVAVGVTGQVWLARPKDLVDATVLVQRQSAQPEGALAQADRSMGRADGDQAVQVGSIHEQVGVVDAQPVDQHLGSLIHRLAEAARANVQQALERAEVTILSPARAGLGGPGGERGARG